MKKILIAFFVFFTVFIYSQNVEGKWKSKLEQNQGMEFKKDGEFILLDLKNPQNNVLKNLKIKYQLKIVEKKNYIEFTYYMNYEIQGKEYAEYRVEKNKLFILEKTDNIENIASQVINKKTEEEFIRFE